MIKLKIPQIKVILIGLISAIGLGLSLGIIVAFWNQSTKNDIASPRLHPCGTATLIDTNGKTIMSWKIQDREIWNVGERSIYVKLCNKMGTNVQLYLGEKQTLIYEPDGTKRLPLSTEKK